MLSYRHGFHAGNHADVFKHWLLVLCIQYMKHKEKALCYLDTHAGAGVYSLTERFAEKTGEFKQGIAQLWSLPEVPALFADYMATVHQYNNQGLTHYPGSAAIALSLLRHQDQLCLVEMHANEVGILKNNLGHDSRLRIIAGDGFQQLKALLPPASRRGLVLIDPPYECKEDYQRVLAGLREARKRFATGTYLVWYPLVDNPFSQRFSAQLQTVLSATSWLDAQLRVKAHGTDSGTDTGSDTGSDTGMYGSGMFIVNPPYLLHEQLQLGLPWLCEQLGQAPEADYRLRNSR